MAAVELQKLDQITFMETGKKWLIPDGLMEESEDGTLWLQISAQQLWPVQPLEQWQCWRKTIFEEFQGAAGIVELQGNCV